MNNNLDRLRYWAYTTHHRSLKVILSLLIPDHFAFARLIAIAGDHHSWTLLAVQTTSKQVQYPRDSVLRLVDEVVHKARPIIARSAAAPGHE